jgi:hypothetical protein
MKIVRYPTTNQWVGTMACPACHHVVRAWRSSGMSECFPHFYCNRCSNAIHRLADQKQVWSVPPSSEILERIAATLPDCSCGGHFKPGANPKCPACGAEFAHQQDAVRRLTDPNVILIHGACLFSDERAPYQVEIVDEIPVA